MLKKLDRSAMNELTGIEKVVNLLIEKFDLETNLVDFSEDSASEVTIRFLNYYKEELTVNDEFIKPVSLLESHGGVCHLSEVEDNSMYETFYARITLSKTQLPLIQGSLELLDPISEEEENGQDRNVPRC